MIHSINLFRNSIQLLGVIILFSIQTSIHSQTTPEPIQLRLGMYPRLIYDSIYPDLMLEFTAQTGIEVRFDDFTEGIYPERLEEFGLYGDLYDVFLVPMEYFDKWLGAGYFRSLDGQIDNPDDFYPVTLEWVTRQGHIYCIPQNTFTLALMYNRDWFDEAGLAYPTNDWTWDDLKANAKALSEFTGLPNGIFLETPVIYWLPLLYQAGGTLTDSNGYWTFNSPQGIESIQFYTDLMQWGGTSVEFSSWGLEAMANQQVGMTFVGSWLLGSGSWINDYEALNWGAVMLPSHTQEATIAFVDCYAVSSTTQYPEASIMLANYLARADVLVRLLSEGAIPTRPSVEDEFVAYWQTIWADYGLILPTDDIRVFPQSLQIAKPFPAQETFLSSFYTHFEENILPTVHGELSAEMMFDRILSELATKTD